MKTFLKKTFSKVYCAIIAMAIAVTAFSFVPQAQAQFHTVVPWNGYKPSGNFTVPFVVVTTGISNNVLTFQPGVRGTMITTTCVGTNANATNGVVLLLRAPIDVAGTNYCVNVYTNTITANSTTSVTNMWFIPTTTFDNVPSVSLTITNANASSITFSNIVVGTY